MRRKLIKAVWSAAKFAAILLVVSLLIDLWRQPEEPHRFAGIRLQSVDGRQIAVEELSRNRVAVLYFWGSWCGICRHTSPAVENLHRDGIPVAAVALQSGSNVEIAAYQRQYGLTFPTVNDENGSLAQSWKVAVTPTLVLLKNGKMIHHTTGLSSEWGLRLRIFLSERLDI